MKQCRRAIGIALFVCVVGITTLAWLVPAFRIEIADRVGLHGLAVQWAEQRIKQPNPPDSVRRVLARHYWSVGEPLRAASALGPLLSALSVDALLSHAISLSEAGRPELAIPQLERVRRSIPDDDRIDAVECLIAANIGDTRRCESNARGLIDRSSPNAGFAHWALARDWARRKEPANALPHWREALSQADNIRKVFPYLDLNAMRLSAAQAALDAHEPDQAESLVNAVTDRERHGVEAGIVTSRLLALRGKPEEALSAACGLVDQYPDDPRVISQLIDILAPSPDVSELRSRLADWRRKSAERDLSQVLSSALDLVDRHPGNEVLLAHLAILQFLADRDDEALRNAERLIAMGGSEKALGHALAASILQARGRVQSALLHYRAALADDRQLAETHPEYDLRHPRLGYADSALAVGYPEEALVQADKLLASAPRAAVPLMIRSEACRLLGKPDEAVAALRTIVAEYPRDQVARLRLAQLLARQGASDDAARLIDEAIQIDSRSPAPRQALAQTLLRAGEIQDNPLETKASADP